MVVDTGYLAAMDATCSIDIETVSGIFALKMASLPTEMVQ